MLDRTQAPDFQRIQKVNLAQARSAQLPNGIGLHWLNAGEQPVLRLEYLFRAGSWYEPQRSASFFTAKMLNEGTKQRSANEISAWFDQFGSFIEINHSAERINLTVYTITKHLPSLLPLLHELITESVFPEKELANVKNITRQNLQVNLQKTSFLAQHRFRELIFGEDHPYGKYTREDDIETTDQAAVVSYYEDAIRERPFDVLLSGQVTEATLRLVEAHLADFDVRKDTISRPDLPPAPSATTHEVIARPDSMQSSIRYGKRLVQPDGQPFTRRSPDYFQVSVLNEILGGYFGSRLMKNIREDKGFTYGIHSSLGLFRQEGFLVIGTDVKKEFTSQTLEEIRREISQLCSEPVPDDELETVKNYLLGSFAGSVTTPFSLADHFKTIYLNGLSYDFFDRYVSAITETTSESLLTLARQYLDADTFTQVIVGGLPQASITQGA